jgi:hypothetical protein
VPVDRADVDVAAVANSGVGRSRSGEGGASNNDGHRGTPEDAAGAEGRGHDHAGLLRAGMIVVLFDRARNECHIKSKDALRHHNGNGKQLKWPTALKLDQPYLRSSLASDTESRVLGDLQNSRAKNLLGVRV